MSIHTGMKFKYKKSKKEGTVFDVGGNEIGIKSGKKKKYINKNDLEDLVDWI